MGWRLPPDPGLPEAGDLLDGAGRALVADFLRASGWVPGAIRPTQVYYRPARSLTVRFDVEARRGDGWPESLMVTGEWRAGDPARVFLFPDDPSLPGLAGAFFAPDAASSPHAPSRDPVRHGIEVLRYRPRRRAVLRDRAPAGGPLYTKVLAATRARRALRAARALRPDACPELHLALPTAGPAPGALRLPPLGGRGLRDLMMAGASLPTPARLAGLSDQLVAMTQRAGAPPLPDSPAKAKVEIASEAAALAGRLLPDLIPQLDKLAGIVTHGIDRGPGDRRPVHGDLYEAQILVAGDGRLGLLDLDDLGMGDPLLDAATFSAHLVALALGHPSTGSQILTYRQELRRAFLENLDAAETDLRWREAYAMLLLASTPFRSLHSDWPAKLTARVEAAIDLGGFRTPVTGKRRTSGTPVVPQERRNRSDPQPACLRNTCRSAGTPGEGARAARAPRR
jgi:phosphotransferase family enzyme